MKKLVTLITLASTLTALADSSQCKRVFKSHYERVELIKTLSLKGEISAEFEKSMMKEEDEFMELSVRVMCDGLSQKKRQKLKLEALLEN